MKIKPASLLQAVVTFVALLAIATLLGCKTTPTPRSIETKSFVVTRLVATKVLAKHPDYREGFTIANADLKTLAVATNITTVEIMEIVNLLPIAELKDGDTALYVESGVLFFSDELSAISVENPEQARAAARGMSRALDRVLAK